MLNVSVIIPVYGVEKYIGKCAQSVFEQTYSNLEIIFVDDCTPDRSIEILEGVLKQYPEMFYKTKIISYPQNRGLAGARKFGLEHASGDYILQIDSDDYIAPSMIESLVCEAQRTQADIIICDYNLIQDGVAKHVTVAPSLNPLECMKQVLKGEVHASLWNKLIRRKLYVEHDIWPVDGLNMREDLSVIYRLLYFSRKLAYVSEPFYNYALRAGSISSVRMNDKQQGNAQDLIEQMNDFCICNAIERQDILDSFSYFKTLILNDILIFGNVQDLKKGLYNDVRIWHILTHPLLPFRHKVMGIFFNLKLKPFVWMYRKMIDNVLLLKADCFGC